MRCVPKLYLVFSLLFMVSCSNDSKSETNREAPPNLKVSTETSDSSGNLYEVGFNQVSSINQDPFVRKSTGEGETLWYIEHEQSEVDVRAVLVVVDSEDVPWVVFSVVGGSYSENYITAKTTTAESAFSGVYQANYGNGGGPKVSVVARLNPETGEIEKATYVIARKNDGKTNGFNIKSVDVLKDRLAFTAESVAWPPTTGSSYRRYPEITDADRTDGVFKVYYEMDLGLQEITKAELIP